MIEPVIQEDVAQVRALSSVAVGAWVLYIDIASNRITTSPATILVGTYTTTPLELTLTLHTLTFITPSI